MLVFAHRTDDTMNAAFAEHVQLRQPCVTARAPLDEWILHRQMTFRAFPLLGFQLLLERYGVHRHVHSHITICERIPPTVNAATHVATQMISPSLIPRSFIITINDAIHGTKRVITTSATRICIGSSDIP
jgi:hypothetical protein